MGGVVVARWRLGLVEVLPMDVAVRVTLMKVPEVVREGWMSHVLMAAVVYRGGSHQGENGGGGDGEGPRGAGPA